MTNEEICECGDGWVDEKCRPENQPTTSNQSNEEIIKKAIEKAVGNGWGIAPMAKNFLRHLEITSHSLRGILFNPEWAKAFFGDDPKHFYPKWTSTGKFETGKGAEMKETIETQVNWKYHQTKLLDEIQEGRDPIKYLEEFL
jgi:hypothetical protein